MIDKKELMKALQNAGVKYSVTNKEADRIFKELDGGDNGYIEYTEFISAALVLKDLLNEHKLDHLMSTFDHDETSKLTRDKVKRGFTILGKNLTKKELDEIFGAHDSNNDGYISKSEFRDMLWE